MHKVTFVAMEPYQGEETLDLTGTEAFGDAQELAEKYLAAEYPYLEDIQVIKIEEDK